MPRRTPAIPFTLAELTAPITLPASVEWPRPVPLCLTWRTRYPVSGVLDGEPAFDCLIEHRFAATISEREFQQDQDEDPHPAWRRLTQLPHVRTELEPDDADAGAVVGILNVAAIPDRVRAQSRESWFMALDNHGSNLGEVADKLADNDDDFGMALIGGTLFWFRELDVHPVFRGQHIGARLLAHALWFLVNDCSDVAILEAFPKRSAFDEQRAEPTAAQVKQLARYYERVGFHPWKRRGPRRAGGRAEEIPMYFLGDDFPEWQRNLEQRVFAE